MKCPNCVDWKSHGLSRGMCMLCWNTGIAPDNTVITKTNLPNFVPGIDVAEVEFESFYPLTNQPKPS